MSLRKILLATTFLTVASVCAAPAAMAADVSDDIAVLKEENAQLQKSLARLMSRLNSLEKKTEATAKAAEKVEKVADKVVTQADDGSFQLPGGTTVKIGGYAKLDLIHDIGARPTSTGGTADADAMSFTNIPLDSDSVAGKRKHTTRLHARQTRLNLATSSDTAWGKLKSYFEMDLFGTAGSALTNNPHTPRLRHAYVEFGEFLAGQAYSTFQDTSVMANVLDFTGPVGTPPIRQAQLRYTHDFEDGNKLFLAVEESEADIRDSAGGTNSNSITRWPDFMAKWRYDGSEGHVALAGLLRNIAYDSGNLGTGSQGNKNVWGYGLSLTGKWTPFKGDQGAYAKDNIYFRLAGGDGIGRYMSETAYSGAAVNQTTSDIDTQFAWGGYAGVQHYWMDTLRSTLVYGHAQIDLSDFLATTTTKKLDSVHTNLIWSPIPSMDIGAEYIYGRREVKSGEQGEVNRLQGSVTYRF